MAPQSLQLAYILTETQREYVTLRHHEGMRVSAIAEARGVSRQTVNQTLLRAYENLRRAGIKPPCDREHVSPEKKDDGPVCVTVDPHVLAEIAQG